MKNIIKLRYKEKNWFVFLLIFAIIGIVGSSVATYYSFVYDLETLKVLSPLSIGVFFAIILQTINVSFVENREGVIDRKKTFDEFASYLLMIILDSEEEKSSSYGLSLTPSFDNLLSFTITELHKLKKYTTKELFEEIKEFYLKLKNVGRMKNRILPEDSPLLSQAMNRADQTRNELDIGEEMKKIIIQAGIILEIINKI